MVTRAINSLYSNVGANLDERDWITIMSSANPLLASELALVQQWQNKSYLLRNAEYLLSVGYPDISAEITYRQMGQRLAYTYSTVWSEGSRFAANSALTDAALASAAAIYAEATARPGLQWRFSGTTASLALDRDVRLTYSISGAAAELAAGTTALLPESAGNTVREGFVTATRDNGLSTTSTVFALIGTDTAISRNYNAGGTTVVDRVAVLGTGADDLRAGGGNDTVYGGGGNDTILGNQGHDRLYGGSGNDVLEAGQGDDLAEGGSGDDRLWGGSAGADTLTGGSGADQFRFSPTNAGVVVTDFSLADDDSIGISKEAILTLATSASASGTPLVAADFDAVASMAGVRADSGGANAGNHQIFVVRSAQSRSTILAEIAGGAQNAFVLVFDSSANQAKLYFDDNWATATGRTEVVTFTGLSLADLQAVGIGSFYAWS
jgi:hypothetical protein